MKKIIDQINIKFNIQIAIAMALSIGLAYSLKLKYAAAAGIVTLATVQTTKKETLTIAFKRLLAYIVMVLLSLVIFNGLGYNIGSFGLFILVFASIIFYFDSPEVLSSNAVMATHFLDSETTNLAIIQNENLIFLIGVGIGILVNIVVPAFAMEMSKEKNLLDQKMQDILFMLYNRLRGIYTIEGRPVQKELAHIYDANQFRQLNSFIANVRVQLLEQQGNMLFSEEHYYLEYFEMRKNQLAIIENIWDDSKDIAEVRAEALIISDYVGEIRSQYHETNTVVALLDRGKELMDYFTNTELPKSRQEFEQRASLYVIYKDLIAMLKLKEAFAKGLSQEEKDKYWNGG